MNAFGTKEISENHRYHIILNVLQLLIVGIVVAECLIAKRLTLWLCLYLFFPSRLSNILLLTSVTDDDIYEVKTARHSTGLKDSTLIR